LSFSVSSCYNGCIGLIGCPMCVLSFLSGFSAVGFSGSRSLLPCSAAALRRVSRFVSPAASVFVGCARGADELCRSLFPAASVLSASSFGRGRGSFAARSVACVRSVASSGGCWVSFPCSPCPVGLLPSSSSSRCFGGFGSGSWSSLALAVGLGVPCLVFLPPAVPCPVGWPLVSVGGGWWVFRPSVVQLSLL
jgi:hypothetical protein